MKKLKLLFLFLLPLFFFLCDSQQDEEFKTNVLFIAIDDLRPELGCYGAEHVKSPNIDLLSEQGVLFNRVYCQAPHCGPSRSSLLSGISPLNYDGIPLKPEELAPGKITLPATFKKAGYYTINNGGNFFLNSYTNWLDNESFRQRYIEFKV